MSTIVTRAGKGAPLTHSEVDANFTNLNADKYQAGDDATFGTVTVTGTVDGRDVSADGAKLDGIEAGATADQTAAEILTAIKTVDGTGSGLDADLLDGNHASAFATAAQGSLADSALQAGDNISSLTNDAGYTTNVGDITGVTAGSGLTGGGSSGSVTISHADTSAQGSVNNSGNAVIQDVTLDTYGHVTGLVSATIIAPTTNGTSGQTLISNGTSQPTWGDAAAGATGGGSDKIFWENDQTVTTNYTITNGQNAMSAGPITINSGVTVTVGSGETWTVV